jgi:hypothetical protein
MRDSEHLFRVAGVFAVGLVLFLGFRAWFVPKSFGQYGHYRGAYLAEAASLPIQHAGHETCETCHTDVLDVKKTGAHAHVNCEACHGPLAKHAEDPSIKPVLPDTAVLCARCHEANPAKPAGFPQVVTKDHSQGLPCNTCHQPHKPGLK